MSKQKVLPQARYTLNSGRKRCDWSRGASGRWAWSISLVQLSQVQSAGQAHGRRQQTGEAEQMESARLRAELAPVNATSDGVLCKGI